jgi:ribosomal protein S18 acetylase RimI-like enzyme
VTGFIVIEPAAADRHPAHDCAEAMEISMLFVHPSTQRNGIGTALLRHAFAVARAQEFRECKCGPEPTTHRLSSSTAASRRSRPAGASRELAQPESADER